MEYFFQTTAENGEVHYIDIFVNLGDVYWGSHFNNGHTDNCKIISIEKFVNDLDEYDKNQMEKIFGKEKFAEIMHNAKQLL